MKQQHVSLRKILILYPKNLYFFILATRSPQWALPSKKMVSSWGLLKEGLEGVLELLKYKQYIIHRKPRK